MRLIATVLALLTAVALAYNIGMRVPAETVALGLGVILGALTSIPLSLIMSAVFGRRAEQPAAEDLEPVPAIAGRPPYPRTDVYQPSRDYPPLVIINPGSFAQGRQTAYAANAMQSMMLPSGPREFRVVGEDAT